MKLVVGLGNYPKEYEFTRHNIGFMFVDNFAQNANITFKTESKLQGEISTCVLNNEKVLLLKPLTFMNLSGESVKKVVNFYKIKVENILIIYDDLSINLGKFRIKANGTDGGHNGMKSIIQHLGTNQIQRVKIGIGPQPQFMKSENFVLQKFSNDQMQIVNKVVDKSTELINDFLFQNISYLQNTYNGIELN